MNQTPITEADKTKLDRRNVIVAGLTLPLVVPDIARAASVPQSKAHNVKRVLIINAHQSYREGDGKLNRSLVALITEEFQKKGCEVKQTYIEQGYDIDAEVQKHLWADLIVTQSPVYWFGTPWIYKKYADEVFNAGLSKQNMLSDDGRTRKDPSKQYGTGGKMQGKKYMLSLTWNAPREAFEDEGQLLFAGKSVDDVFINNTANYKFCGVEILPSFSCFNVLKEPDIANDFEKLKQHLTSTFG